jgi:hypothetical protein
VVSGDRRNVPAVVESAIPVTTSTLKISLAVPAMIAEAGDPRFLRRFDRKRQHAPGLLPGRVLLFCLA